MFGGGRSGPPVMPVLPSIKNTDEFGRPLRRPRPGLERHARRAWLAAAAFAALAAVLVAAGLWGWLMPGGAAVTRLRGALVGGLVGLLAPPAASALFALYLLLTGSEPLETLTWIFAVASATLALAWAVAVPPAAVLGAVLGAIYAQVLTTRSAAGS